ncbi:hypothetical protein FQZ97_801960 [compost metagenome]
MLGGMIKNDLITLLHANIFVKHAKTDLWTLKILQDSNWLADLYRCLTDPSDLIVALGVVTMTKIQTETVYTSKC